MTELAKPKQAVGRRYGNGSMGTGWGGPAKGAGNGTAREPLTDYQSRTGETTRRRMAREEEAEIMADIVRSIAMDPHQPGMVRASAANSRLDRILGKPVQMNVNLSADDVSNLSDEELAAEIARLSGEETILIEGSASTDVSE